MNDRSAPESFDILRLAEVLEVLASPVRLDLLRFAQQPHYLEEIAAHLRLTRQATRWHVDRLVAEGLLERRPSLRPTGPVTEYVVRQSAFYLLYSEFEKLGNLRAEEASGEDNTIMRRGAGEATPPPLPCLQILRGIGVGRMLPLRPTARAWVLGRDRDVDIVLDYDPFVSSRHAEVRRDGAAFLLADLGSRNGTFRNWRRIDAARPEPLSHGDVLGVGDTLMLLRARP